MKHLYGRKCVDGIVSRGRPKSEEARGRPRASILSRRCPTLPRRCQRSTIGAEGLNFRVRNGNGCDPSAMVAGKLEFSKTAGTLPQARSESKLESNSK